MCAANLPTYDCGTYDTLLTTCNRSLNCKLAVSHDSSLLSVKVDALLSIAILKKVKSFFYILVINCTKMYISAYLKKSLTFIVNKISNMYVT